MNKIINWYSHQPANEQLGIACISVWIFILAAYWLLTLDRKKRPIKK
jgi:hypothetical protein